MAALDPRIMRISIEVRGQIRSYTDVAITATGTKFTNTTQGECNITVANLRKDVTDFILTETSPFNRNRTPKIVTLEAGRQSTGLSLVYSGNIFRSSISQPPDSILSIRALTLQFQKGNIVTRSLPANTSLSSIAQRVADDVGLPLNFQADNKQVGNYSFVGSAAQQLNKLADLSNIDVFADGGQMIVKNRGQAIQGKVRRLNSSTGLIGVPTFTEAGARITMLYDSQVVIGGELDITSEQYPALSGRYEVYKLAYNLANRDTPFYYTADCRRLN